MIIAVDFDGTLVENKYPEIGKPISRVVDYVQKRHEKGDTIILWTCRMGTYLDEAVKFCERNNIPIDIINDNCPKQIDAFESNPRKISADIYLDDKALHIADIDVFEFYEK
jgi:hypothetical protein